MAGLVGRLGIARPVSHRAADVASLDPQPDERNGAGCVAAALVPGVHWSMVRVVDSQYDEPTSGPAYVPAEGITMFSTSWCGFCRRLRFQLQRENVPFTEVDIEEHQDAADIVTELNRGNRTVPTVLFPDGSAATNPSITEVKARLAS